MTVLLYSLIATLFIHSKLLVFLFGIEPWCVNKNEAQNVMSKVVLTGLERLSFCIPHAPSWAVKMWDVILWTQPAELLWCSPVTKKLRVTSWQFSYLCRWTDELPIIYFWHLQKAFRVMRFSWMLSSWLHCVTRLACRWVGSWKDTVTLKSLQSSVKMEVYDVVNKTNNSFLFFSF